jgi:predicted alpha/beta hydrolase
MLNITNNPQRVHFLPEQAHHFGSDSMPTQVRSNCETQHITLNAADGFPLAAIRYTSSTPVRANLVVAGATGVPQGFYRRFAKFAAANGYTTLTLDYRGIGLSAPSTLKGFKMDYFDWGRLDLAAAVEAMSCQQTPLYVIGHSYGGHAFGVLPNHQKVAAFVTFGTGAGWNGWMPPLERIKVLAMWHILGPLLTRWKGYLAWSLLGMGEDLPLGFYRQWKRWCRYPNYFFDDPDMQAVARDFASVHTRILAANAIDDRWSPPQSRNAFMAGYSNAACEKLDIDPAHFGLSAMGHMGYFRIQAKPLWQAALEWLDTGVNSGFKTNFASPLKASPRPTEIDHSDPSIASNQSIDILDGV